jgi:hypothetical protein
MSTKLGLSESGGVHINPGGQQAMGRETSRQPQGEAASAANIHCHLVVHNECFVCMRRPGDLLPKDRHDAGPQNDLQGDIIIRERLRAPSPDVSAGQGCVCLRLIASPELMFDYGGPFLISRAP